jgi:hypothetical protein
VRFSAIDWKEIESAVGAGDEAVDAGSDENGCWHGGTSYCKKLAPQGAQRNTGDLRALIFLDSVGALAN